MSVASGVASFGLAPSTISRRLLSGAILATPERASTTAVSIALVELLPSLVAWPATAAQALSSRSSLLGIGRLATALAFALAGMWGFFLAAAAFVFQPAQIGSVHGAWGALGGLACVAVALMLGGSELVRTDKPGGRS